MLERLVAASRVQPAGSVFESMTASHIPFRLWAGLLVVAPPDDSDSRPVRRPARLSLVIAPGDDVRPNYLCGIRIHELDVTPETRARIQHKGNSFSVR